MLSKKSRSTDFCFLFFCFRRSVTSKVYRGKTIFYVRVTKGCHYRRCIPICLIHEHLLNNVKWDSVKTLYFTYGKKSPSDTSSIFFFCYNLLYFDVRQKLLLLQDSLSLLSSLQHVRLLRTFCFRFWSPFTHLDNWLYRSSEGRP